MTGPTLRRSGRHDNRTLKTLRAFASATDVMFQLRYRGVPDASEQPNLMVNEGSKAALSGVSRSWYLVFPWFVSLFALANPTCKADPAENTLLLW